MLKKRLLQALKSRPSLLARSFGALPSISSPASKCQQRYLSLLSSPCRSKTSPLVSQSILADTSSSSTINLSAFQIRYSSGARDTYNPSHFVRKRRHGFLSRLRCKKKRKILVRRRAKGRRNLSH